MSPRRTELQTGPFSKKIGNVTTVVTVGEAEFEDVNGVDVNSGIRYPANVITVSRELVRAVDRISDTCENNVALASGLGDGGNNDEGGKGSEEGLYDKI